MVRLRFPRLDVLVSLGCLALLMSFAWYAYKGPRGFAYQVQLEQQLAEYEALRDKASADKYALETRVTLIRPEKVDRDMLEQLARTQLNLALPNELIVLTKD
jgi:cell division protein FtsB